jgi:hypothetical protein
VTTRSSTAEEANPLDELTGGDSLINVLDTSRQRQRRPHDGTEVGERLLEPATDAGRHRCIADESADEGRRLRSRSDTDHDLPAEGRGSRTNRSGKLDARQGNPRRNASATRRGDRRHRR